MGWFIPALIGYGIAKMFSTNKTQYREREIFVYNEKITPKTYLYQEWIYDNPGCMSLQITSKDGVKLLLFNKKYLQNFKDGKSINCWWPGMYEKDKDWYGKVITWGAINNVKTEVGNYIIAIFNPNDKEIEVQLKVCP